MLLGRPMTSQHLSRSILEYDQWSFFEQLARSFTPHQAHWLGGCFSGLGARTTGHVEAPVPGAHVRRLTI